jgi:hypothetical protein
MWIVWIMLGFLIGIFCMALLAVGSQASMCDNCQYYQEWWAKCHKILRSEGYHASDG